MDLAESIEFVLFLVCLMMNLVLYVLKDPKLVNHGLKEVLHIFFSLSIFFFNHYYVIFLQKDSNTIGNSSLLSWLKFSSVEK